MIEWLQEVLTPQLLMYLMLSVNVCAVVGIFVNALKGQTVAVPQKKSRRTRKKPRKIDAQKIYYNLEEEPVKLDGDNGIENVKSVVDTKLKLNGTLEAFPPPPTSVPEDFKELVHNAKNNIDKPVAKPDEEPLIKPLGKESEEHV